MRRQAITRTGLAKMTSDEAAAWWLLAREGDVAVAEAGAFESWLEESEANRAAWRRAQTAWDSFDQAAANDETLEAMRAEALAARPGRWSARNLGVAAAIAVAVCGSVLLLGFGRGFLPIVPGSDTLAAQAPLRTVGSPDYRTARGEVSVVSLEDGSKLTLDTDSASDVAFTPGERRVRLLQGRAHLAVARDATRPFIVEAAGRTVVALGTEFVVRVDSEVVTVALVEGRVSVRGGEGRAGATVLHPGQQLVSAAGRPDVLSRADVAAAGSWRQGLLTFDEVSLAEASRELNRYSEQPIVIDDASAGRLPISGVFRAGDNERFARAVAQIHPIRVEAGPDKVVIRSAGG